MRARIKRLYLLATGLISLPALGGLLSSLMIRSRWTVDTTNPIPSPKARFRATDATDPMASISNFPTLRVVEIRALAAAVCLALSACATYRPLPLDNGRPRQKLVDIIVSATSMPVPTLQAHRFHPSDGMDVTEVAMLAVANSPDLRSQRDDEGIARAQAFAAGLLPDPQVSYERDRPDPHQAENTPAFNLGLTWNLGDLLTRSARVASAKAGTRQVHLVLLWSEWQTIAKARTLFDKVLSTHALVARLQIEQDALAPIQQYIERALEAGDLTYDSASAGLNAFSDVDNKLADAQRQLDTAEHDLHDLLGLQTSVPLHLVGSPYSVEPDAVRVAQALQQMPKRRPDLLALQAGYESQQQKLRAAVLAQFPAITVGFVRARDTSNIRTSGWSVGLSLPLLDGNRGNIAVERATRQKLRDEYQARLLTDRNDVDRLLALVRSHDAQHPALVAHAAQLAQARDAAQRAFDNGLLDWPTYLAIRASSLAADTDLFTQQQNAEEQAIALDALVGTWPHASTAMVRK
jgi:outer membrane protein, heavy metal efflux system